MLLFDDNIREIIARVRTRPESWLGGKSVRTLEAFLRGLCVGVSESLRLSGIDSGFEGSEISQFFEWLRERHPERRTWVQSLLSESGEDESAAMRRFFVLWDEFSAARS